MKKEWWQSKTVWAGIVIAVVGLARVFGLELPTDIVVTIAGGFGLVGIRDALN